MDKIRSFKHNSYKAIAEEFLSLFPELTDQVHDYSKHVWSKTRRGIKVHLKNGLTIIFEVMDFTKYSGDGDGDEYAWSSFRTLLIPAFVEHVEEKK